MQTVSAANIRTTLLTKYAGRSKDRHIRRLRPECPKAFGRSTAEPKRSGQKIHALTNALMRADNRDSFRATVLECTMPLPEARCISGCAARNASAATDLSPLAIATSTFLTKVRMRDFRAALRAVRTLV